MSKKDYALMVLGCDKNIELIPMFLRQPKKILAAIRQRGLYQYRIPRGSIERL